jgi:hypothetical protein
MLSAAEKYEGRRASQVEELIASCMERRGFEYVPAPDGSSSVAAQFPAAEFRERFGYGVVAPLLHPRLFDTTASSDLNEELRGSLNRNEQRAYLRALYGGRVDARAVHSAAGEVVAEIFPASCVTLAQAAIFGDQFRLARASARFNRLVSELNAAVDEDVRTIAVMLAWRRCMERKGFFGPPAAIQEYLRHRLAMILERHQADPNVRLPQRLRHLIRFERLVAGADVACRLETGTHRVIGGVRAKYETDFVLDHLQLLRTLFYEREFVTRIASTL